jgi:hypothetical protein
MTPLSEITEQLFIDQLRDWELARLNYGLLSRVLTRKVDFGSFSVAIQFNPERIRSSAAKVDSKTIDERPCFLCAHNRPAEQKGVPFGNRLNILVNPYPIFSKHLTITSEKHVLQRISGNFELMLQLSQALGDYIVFYNGPQCGASAPDHFHFQAGKRGFLPLESDFETKGSVRLIASAKLTGIWCWVNYLRGIITLTGSDISGLSDIFERFYTEMSMHQPDKPEPMLNILAYFEKGEWRVHLIPRKVHRPAQFFAPGDEQILLSPASVDIGGVLITPRESDFRKISEKDVEDIFRQVCYSDKEILHILNNIV